MDKAPQLIIETEVRYKGLKRVIRLEMPTTVLAYPVALRVELDSHLDQLKKVMRGIIVPEKK